MKYLQYLFLSILLYSTPHCHAQESKIDSLRNKLATTKSDTSRLNLLIELSWAHQEQANQDSAMAIAVRALQLAQEIGDEDKIIKRQIRVARLAWNSGDFPTAIKLGYALLEYGQLKSDSALIEHAYVILQNNYRDQGDFKEALDYAFKILEICKQIHNCSECAVINGAIASIHLGLEQYDSALTYINTSLSYPPDFAIGWTQLIAGRIAEKLNEPEQALQYYQKSILDLQKRKNFKDLAGAYTSTASLHNFLNQSDSAIYYARLAIDLAKANNTNRELLEAYLVLSKVMESIDVNEALWYYKLAMALSQSIYNQEKQKQISSYKFNELLRQNEINAAQQKSRDRIRMNTLLGSTFTLIIIALLLYRNSRQKHKSKQKIEQAYDQLKSTQSQLIQSEKMASLGELTAGIAHEIQNPLNFVNNFSEVSNEMIKEILDGRHKTQDQNAKSEEDEMLNDIAQNLEKINHHGKRAGEIVKGMLQHSRVGSGKKEPTDINALCDEYLRLSYHGLRAKDKDFNAKFETDFDTTLEKINVVPQDIGRVILNLITNAFYVVNEKANNKQRATSNESYEPTVSVSTKHLSPAGGGKGVVISVKDNGNGIPDSIKEKIFQPFFTTKPSGQGTGLGLSLSYDIVKAHNGELSVKSNEGEGSEFVIQLSVV